jgi:putative hydrolase of the HAD superfamily
MVKAVLFDLDDTLFDHRCCSGQALAKLHAAHPAFQALPFSEFERLHTAYLDEIHPKVQTGEIALDDARQQRFRRLFETVGVVPDEEVVVRAASAYRDGYRQIRRPIDGALRLLTLVGQHARIGIVSNNLLEEQQDKLHHCGLSVHVDVLVVSGETGVAKPDPAIFHIALERLGCRADEAVMVGDSWTADIVGARAAGIRPIWFNPLGKPSPEPGARVAELRSLEPPEAALTIIFSGAVPPPRVAVQSGG